MQRGDGTRRLAKEPKCTAEGVGRAGGGAAQHVLPTVAKEAPAPQDEESEGRVRISEARPPSCCHCPPRQQACDSWVSLTAAFSWGEIKRLGDVGTCWPQEPKQCLI